MSTSNLYSKTITLSTCTKEINMTTEKIQYMAPISIPVLVPPADLVEKFSGEFPAMFQFLVESGKMTAEELVSYLQFRATMHEIAGSPDEFLNIYRMLKKAISPIATPESSIIIPTR